MPGQIRRLFRWSSSITRGSASHPARRGHVDARARELPSPLQLGLWLIRARAGERVPAAVADRLGAWLRARPRPFTPLEALDGGAFVKLDVPELRLRIDRVRRTTAP